MITTFCPLGLTSNTSRSSGHVWLRFFSVTVTFATVPFRLETTMIEGYGGAAPWETAMGAVLVNEVPLAAAVTMTRVEAVTLDKLAVTFALPIVTAVTNPVLFTVATGA